jgi:hypothetical protein
MHDDELPQVLRDAYRQLPSTAAPSWLLWRRTRATLTAMGMLREDRRRARWTPAWLIAATLAGVMIGWGAARQQTPAEHPDALIGVATDPLQAAQMVQRTGTAHALALEALVRSLEHAHQEELMLGQQVTMAALRAQARALGHLVSTEAAAVREPGPRSGRPVIWF